MKYSVVNTALALTAAFLLTILLHEAVHYLTAMLLGAEATLFHNRVQAGISDKLVHQLLFAGVAPVLSLIIGFVCYWASRTGAPSAGKLFLLYCGLAGIITFCGYMLIGPIAPFGDTGKVLGLLQVPLIAQVILAILSIVLVTVFLVRATPSLERYAGGSTGDLRTDRKRASLYLVLYPLLISITIVSLLQFPIPHFLSVLATLCAPMALMAVFGSVMGRDVPLPEEAGAKPLHQQISWSLAGLFLLAVVLNRCLVFGWS